jgi:predicted nucleotidyltransferase component of viral defense system
MIPLAVIRAWRANVNWPTDEQVEQDLIISSVLVQLFNHPYIADNVAFRGGTALHKVILPNPLRYSEDIDLNRLNEGHVKPLLSAIDAALKDFLGTKRTVKINDGSVKIYYKYKDVNSGDRNLKIEIKTREILPQKSLVRLPYSVNSTFFKGTANLNIFNVEEMTGTKIRALYQRNKGRDLFDLYSCSQQLTLDWNEVVRSFKLLNIGATQKQYRDNLENKMQDPEFTDDISRLLPTNVKYNPQDGFKWFFAEILPKL